MTWFTSLVYLTPLPLKPPQHEHGRHSNIIAEYLWTWLRFIPWQILNYFIVTSKEVVILICCYDSVWKHLKLKMFMKKFETYFQWTIRFISLLTKKPQFCVIFRTKNTFQNKSLSPLNPFPTKLKTYVWTYLIIEIRKDRNCIKHSVSKIFPFWGQTVPACVL